MVKLRGPMFSLGASGSIANAITFATWKGRPYCREKVVPANPKTGLQTGFRAMFAFLSQQWKNLAAIDQATFDTLADTMDASAFNAYQRFNQKRWRNYDPPAMAMPAVGTGTPATWTSAPAATAGVDSIVIDWDVNAIGDNWGMLIFRADGTGFTPSISNCIKVIELVNPGIGTWLDSPLDPGAYYYDTRLFTEFGLFAALDGEITATVL